MKQTMPQYPAAKVYSAREDAIRLRLPNLRLTLKSFELPELVNNLTEIGKNDWHLHLLLERENHDLLDGRYIKTLKHYGVESISTTLSLNPKKPEETIGELHFLREAACHYMRVDWTLTSLVKPVDYAPLVHCTPPGETNKNLSEWASLWRQNHINEGLTFRRGPGFILIRDKRPTLVPQLFQTLEPDDYQLFWYTRKPVSMEKVLKNFAEDKLNTYLEHKLFLQIGNWVINLVNPANKKIIPYL